MNTRQIIDYALDDDAKSMRESLYASIFDRVTSAIEAKKQEVAHGLLGGMPMGESVDHSCEDGKEGHEDEVADKKLVKKMVKKSSLKTEEEQKAFKKQAKKMIKGLRKEGYDLSNLDEETIEELTTTLLNDAE
jgi:hypothetical protein